MQGTGPGCLLDKPTNLGLPRVQSAPMSCLLMVYILILNSSREKMRKVQQLRFVLSRAYCSHFPNPLGEALLKFPDFCLCYITILHDMEKGLLLHSSSNCHCFYLLFLAGFFILLSELLHLLLLSKSFLFLLPYLLLIALIPWMPALQCKMCH